MQIKLAEPGKEWDLHVAFFEEVRNGCDDDVERRRGQVTDLRLNIAVLD